MEKQQSYRTTRLSLELIIKQARNMRGILMPPWGLYGSADVFLAISCTSRCTEETFGHKKCFDFPYKVMLTHFSF